MAADPDSYTTRHQTAASELSPVQEGEEGGLNLTHTIHRLQFGTPVKQLQHPLDGAPCPATRRRVNVCVCVCVCV